MYIYRYGKAADLSYGFIGNSWGLCQRLKADYCRILNSCSMEQFCTIILYEKSVWTITSRDLLANNVLLGQREKKKESVYWEIVDEERKTSSERFCFNHQISFPSIAHTLSRFLRLDDNFYFLFLLSLSLS